MLSFCEKTQVIAMRRDKRKSRPAFKIKQKGQVMINKR